MNISPTRCLSLALLLTMVACGGGGGSSAPPSQPVPTISAQVLMNTGFEQTSPIVWQGDTSVIYPNQDATYTAHSGSHFAYLGGYGAVQSDQITQDLYIPSTAQSAALTFYLKIITDETGAASKDTLTVAALNTSGTTLGTLLTKSNLNAADYTAYSVNLLPYKGQVLRLSFKSQEDTQNQTSFLLDDVLATIAAPLIDLTPIISGFTPTSGIAAEQTVQITGKNFFGLTAVSIGSASATYVLTDGTALSATVPAGAATGSIPIQITNAQGTGSSATNFVVAYGAPTITGVNPNQGPVGTPVVITGTYLGYPGTTVTLNGLTISSFTQTPAQITFTVPPAAPSGSGNLVVTTPGGTQTKPFTVNAATTTLDLHIEKVELTQSTQTLDNSVPVVAGKDGLIRVFVLANQTNAVSPSVQITILNGTNTIYGPITVPAPAAGVPTSLNESSLLASWNMVVPGTALTTPLGGTYTITATVNGGGAIPEADTTNNTKTVFPAATTVPIFKTTIFPVVLSTGKGDISEANKAQWVARLAKMYPVSSVDVTVGATFTPSTPNVVSTLSTDNSDSSWSYVLLDLQTKHLADAATASDRYYYGALHPYTTASGSVIAGLGYAPATAGDLLPFPYRTAIGWDAKGYSDGGNFPEVFAHETGHNMGRNHSPCPSGTNAPSGIDPAYPYAGASIGVWGYDSVSGLLQDPATVKDIMAYCSPDWVSDYTYKGILNYRGVTGGFLTVGSEVTPQPKPSTVAQECLLVRGIVHGDGRVELLPSFRTKAMPSGIPSAGEYSLECQDQQGVPIYSAFLELLEVGCSPQWHEHHFAMALPLSSTVLDSIASLNILKAGQVKAGLRSVSAAVQSLATKPEVRRLDGDRVRLTWDAAIHPTVLVRDADSSEVIAILSGGTQTLQTKARRLDLVFSAGLSGGTHHLEIPD